MISPTLEPGTRLGPFEIGTLLGRGGMGEVYRALHTEIGMRVALKLLTPALAGENQFVERFVREARLMRTLDHPGIVAVYEAGDADGRLYLSMRLVGDGRSLKDMLAEERPSIARTVDILGRLADAIDYAHGRGVIHRDIKPANVLLDEDSRPALADFGLASALDEVRATTLSYQVLGTPAYSAPEQSRPGPIGHQADLYSFACVAFEMLTGSGPFADRTTPVGIAVAHATEIPPRITQCDPALPTRLDEVFVAGLAKSPMARPASARQLVAAIEAALDPALDSATGRARSSSRPLRLIAIPVLATAALAAAVLAWPHTTPDPTIAASTAHPQPTGVASAAPPSPTIATPVSVVPPAAVGAPFFTARFADPDSTFVDDVGRPRNPQAEQVDFQPDALVLSASAPNSDAGTDLQARINTGYLMTMNVAVAPQSKVIFDVGLRWAEPGKLAYLLRTDTSTRQLYLAILQNGKVSPLTAPVPAADIIGRAAQIAVRLDGDTLTLWLDGRQVSSVRDNRVEETAGTIPGLDVYGRPGTGSVRIDALTYYNLLS